MLRDDFTLGKALCIRSVNYTGLFLFHVWQEGGKCAHLAVLFICIMFSKWYKAWKESTEKCLGRELPMESGKTKQGDLKRERSPVMLKKNQMGMLHGHAQVGTVGVGLVVLNDRF